MPQFRKDGNQTLRSKPAYPHRSLKARFANVSRLFPPSMMSRKLSALVSRLL